jgi:hypothetical protein
MDKDTVVSMRFWSGHTAKTIFSLTGNLVGEIPITCYKDTFEITHALTTDENTNAKTVVSFKPNIKFFLEYKTDPDKFNNGDFHLITPPTQNFIKFVGSAGKKDSLDLTVKSSDTSILYANISQSDSDGDPVNRFRNDNIERTIIKFKDCTSDPNVKVPMSSFCDICSQINKHRREYRSVTIYGYKNGMSISGDGIKFDLGRKWGNTDGTPIGKYTLTTDKNKFLSNIGTLADRGVLMFFFDDTKIRMVFPVAYYGEMTIIFVNGKEEEIRSIDEQQDDSDETAAMVSGWFEE